MIIGRDGDIVLRELIEEDLLKLAEYAPFLKKSGHTKPMKKAQIRLKK